MFVIGLTGSMASGKSSLIIRIKRLLKWPVWDADAEVQKLYLNPAILEKITTQFPQTNIGGRVDRQILRSIIAKNGELLGILESILYPALAMSREKFLEKMQRYHQEIVVLDIPLLFEKNLDLLCDLTVVVHCPEFIQKQRIMRRPGMTESLMKKLLDNQFTPYEKAQRADIVIDSGLNHHHTWEQFTKQVVRKIS